MRRIELDPMQRDKRGSFAKITDLSTPSSLEQQPLTHEEKTTIIRTAYSEGYLRILSEEEQMLLETRYIDIEGTPMRQRIFMTQLGVTTRAGVNYRETRAIEELDRFRKLLEGEEVDQRWKRGLTVNPRALSYLRVRVHGLRALARLLGVKHRQMPDILRSNGITVKIGRPATDLSIFGDDPKKTLSFSLSRGQSGSQIGRTFEIGQTTANRIIRNLGIQRPRNS